MPVNPGPLLYSSQEPILNVYTMAEWRDVSFLKKTEGKLHGKIKISCTLIITRDLPCSNYSFIIRPINYIFWFANCDQPRLIYGACQDKIWRSFAISRSLPSVLMTSVIITWALVPDNIFCYGKPDRGAADRGQQKQDCAVPDCGSYHFVKIFWSPPKYFLVKYWRTAFVKFCVQKSRENEMSELIRKCSQ